MAFKTYKDWPDDLMLDEYLQVGDTVDEEMFEHFLDVLPPRYYSGGLLNVGGAMDTVDNGNGVYKSTFITFVDTGSEYVFKGECFAGEDINRNPKLEPVTELILYDIYEEKKLTSSELRDYYRRVTGLDNDSELSDVEVQYYLLDTLAENSLEKEAAQKMIEEYRESNKISSVDAVIAKATQTCEELNNGAVAKSEIEFGKG